MKMEVLPVPLPSLSKPAQPAPAAPAAPTPAPAPAAATNSAGKPRVKKGAERRRSARRDVNTPAELIVCPASSRTAPIKVTVRDISATGVGLVHSEPLPLGQKYVVREPSIIPRSQPCLYTVVRADPAGEGKYSIGLHASHLMGLEVGEKTGRAKVAAMARLLILAIIVGGAIALAWTVI
jgi:hypothetical protein